MNKDEINKLLNDLFPLNRSITGNGLRESFKVLFEFTKWCKILITTRAIKKDLATPV